MREKPAGATPMAETMLDPGHVGSEGRSWKTIRRVLQTHCYTTIVVPTKGGKTYRLRRAVEPEELQKTIYEKLGIAWGPLPRTKVEMEAADLRSYPNPAIAFGVVGIIFWQVGRHGRVSTCMKRLHLIEIEDQDWCPHSLRDAATDYLQCFFSATRINEPIIPILGGVLRRAGSRGIVDLCSGAAGPWLWLQPALAESGVGVPICLTDKYPNLEGFRRANRLTDRAIGYHPQPVDPMQVPASLPGFRTMFSAFHHFRPGQARAVLADAVRSGEGIAVFEATQRRPLAILFALLAPLGVFLVTPFIRPFRWSRLFWTYVVPLAPLVTLFDGVVSCLRTYSLQDMRDLADSLGSSGYQWEMGTVKGGRMPIPITYLVGAPVAKAA